MGQDGQYTHEEFMHLSLMCICQHAEVHLISCGGFANLSYRKAAGSCRPSLFSTIPFIMLAPEQLPSGLITVS
jgi:hypothetical protein